jgi:hypothetical protein
LFILLCVVGAKASRLHPYVYLVLNE